MTLLSSKFFFFNLKKNKNILTKYKYYFSVTTTVPTISSTTTTTSTPPPCQYVKFDGIKNLFTYVAKNFVKLNFIFTSFFPVYISRRDDKTREIHE